MIDLDISGATPLTNAMMKQVPFAIAKAITQTAIQAQTDIVHAMTHVFDRPTPYTLNSTYVSPATKDRLEATVKLKEESAKGLPATKYLAPEVFGGNRNAKRSEVALRNSLNLDGQHRRSARCSTTKDTVVFRFGIARGRSGIPSRDER